MLTYFALLFLSFFAASVSDNAKDRLAAYIKGVEEKRSVSGGADAEIHELILSILREAQAEVKTNPMTDVVDPFYAEANSETHPAEEGKEGEKKTPKQREFDMKYALREHVHDIRALGKELCARSRSLRYFSWVRDFQNGKAVVCEARSALCACNKEDGTVKQLDSGVLSSCGHVGCLKCLHYHAGKDECVDRYVVLCEAQIHRYRVCFFSSYYSYFLSFYPAAFPCPSPFSLSVTNKCMKIMPSTNQG